MNMPDEGYMAEIILDPGKNLRILSGKGPGIDARKYFKLDELDARAGRVLVKVVPPIMTSSFILGMFSKSVRVLGEKSFYQKYEFQAAAPVIENIRKNVQYSSTGNVALP